LILIERIAIERRKEADWVKLRESLKKAERRQKKTQQESALIESTAGSRQSIESHRPERCDLESHCEKKKKLWESRSREQSDTKSEEEGRKKKYTECFIKTVYYHRVD
jgi:hypothetical protein